MEVTKPDTSYAAAAQARPVPPNGGNTPKNVAARRFDPQPSVSAVAEPTAAPATAQPEQLFDAVEDLQSAVESLNRKMNFSVDEQSGRFFVKVIDTSTDEVIREIPPEKVLKIVAHFKELIGLLFDETV